MSERGSTVDDRSRSVAAPVTRGRASAAARGTAVRGRSPAKVAPVLVRQFRDRIVESQHRGDIVEADADGGLIRVLGDPDRVVTLRSTVKPFGLVALIEAGGIAAFDLTSEEIALMASSHSGEDLHVRTLHALYRRAGIAQAPLACGSEGMPLDALTAARLARDGEHPSPLRHMCSGQHSALILLSRLRGWPMETYWQNEHPAQLAFRAVVAATFGVAQERLVLAPDSCGIPTFAFPLRHVARAFAFFADPAGVGARNSRAGIGPALLAIRDAMLAHPEMVGGTRDRLDTSLMRAVPGRVVSKSGAEALHGVAILPGTRVATGRTSASGLAIKIEDGDGFERAGVAAVVEALAQVGVLGGQPLRMLGRYHRPPSLDSHGRVAAEAVPEFDLAPVGELI